MCNPAVEDDAKLAGGCHMNIAVSFLRMGAFPYVVGHCTEALKLGPPSWQAFHFMAFSKMNLGHLDDARADFTQALKCAEGNPNATNEITTVMKDLAKHEEAMAAQKAAAAANGGVPPPLTVQGSAVAPGGAAGAPNTVSSAPPAQSPQQRTPEQIEELKKVMAAKDVAAVEAFNKQDWAGSIKLWEEVLHTLALALTRC